MGYLVHASAESKAVARLRYGLRGTGLACR